MWSYNKCCITLSNINKMNFSKAIPDFPYRYKFCGLPIGVSILPRLADIVCKTTTGISHFFSSVCPIISNSTKVNGTKVMSATSLVIIILKKKQSKVSVTTSWRIFFTLFNSFREISSKTPTL